MDAQELTILDGACNSIIVKSSKRKFPGVIIQGDTLHSWSSILAESKKCILASDMDEASNCISELQALINAQLAHYETVLRELNLKLPY